MMRVVKVPKGDVSQALSSAWTALCLAFIESLILLVLNECFYFVEIVILKHNTGIEGVNFPVMLLQEAFVVFGFRISFGFVLVPTAALLICRAMKIRLPGPIMGIFNLACFLIAALIWERPLGLLEHFHDILTPLFRNGMHLLLVACLISPLILLRIPIWGNLLPGIHWTKQGSDESNLDNNK